MRLARVEIKGFKSIAKKTVLSFPGNVTCIAGPNGCGKSNVIDAIRWALGEQSARAMRAGSMGDVIFAGASDVPPGSMASVTLEFVNDGGPFPKEMEGFNEISIARRLFRTGESVYTINNVRCRLKDITDLFLDTGLDKQGYAIIEQGKVKDIIMAKPEDIRHVIEEVAEVGKFRVKRGEALKRLEATRGNLERIQDLLSEVGKQRDSLKTQANKARRYQVLKDDIGELTRLSWGAELRRIDAGFAQLEEKRADVENARRGIQEQIDMQNASAQETKGALEALKASMDATEAALREARARLEVARGEEQTNELRLKDTGNTLQMLEERRRKAQEDTATAQDEIAACSREREDLAALVEDITAEHATHKDSVEASATHYNTAQADYDAKRAELFDQIGHARAMDQRLGFLRQRHQEATANISKRGGELESMAAEESALAAEIAALEEEMEGFAGVTGEQQEALQRLMSERRDLQACVEQEGQQLIGMEKHHTELSTKISMLSRIVNKSAAPAQSGAQAGFKRLADAIEVAKGFEETAGSMGDILDYYIIDDHADILGPEGVSTQGPGFIPSRPHLRAHTQDSLPSGEGVLDALHNYVTASQGYEEVLAVFTRGKWVVEDISHAVHLWRQGHRDHTYITRDGMMLETSGVVHTIPEKDKYTEVFKAKAEMQTLGEQKAALEEKLIEARERHKGLREAVAKTTGAIESATAEIRRREKELEALKSKRSGVENRRVRLAERRATFDQDVRSWENKASQMAAEIEQAGQEKEIIDGRTELLQCMLKDLDDKRQGIKDQVETLSGAMQAVQNRLNTAKTDLAAREERLKALRQMLERRTQEQASDSGRIAELQAQERELGKARAGLAQAVMEAGDEIARREAAQASLQPEHREISEKLAAISGRLDDLTAARQALEKSSNELQLSCKEQEIARRMLFERYTARFSTGELPEIPEGFNIDDARQEIAKLQTRIDTMGQINFSAIESHEETQTRYDDLHRQFEDLVLAGTRLRELITSIERESTKEFLATYTKVRANFQEIFNMMFGGGQADLVLQEEGGLDAGVEIFACPPFKRLKAMSLLSEGEKTLCAISFIFALFKVRPSPFCILDEVDAPLDDANVERLNRLVASFTQDSQFIVVTHNKNTMQIADVIYGVTFEVPGVTKVISLDLQQVSAATE